MTQGGAGVASGTGQMTVAGRYRLVRSIGSGGMGRIWQAHDELLDREVAVKELVAPPGMSEQDRKDAHLRTVREAQAAARLDHPGVVRVHDVVRTTGRSWIVMEYVPSRSLFDLIHTDGPLSHREAARIGVALLSALRAAHAVGVLHRDVKPQNVLIGTGGRVVLTDFGLATFGNPPGGTEQLLGSPNYVAPERLRDGTSGPATDLWSLGATLYTAVEGRPPHSRPSVPETLTAVLTDAPDPPRHPGPLHAVIAALLTNEPAARMTPEHADSELHAVALRAVGSVTVAAPRQATGEVSVQPGPPPPAPRRRTRIGLAVAGAALLVAGGAGFALTRDPAVPAAPAAARLTSSTAPLATTSPCAGATPRPLAGRPAPAPVALPDGWSWHLDPAGFALPVPQGWSRATGTAIVCFTDPAGARTFTVATRPELTNQPLRYWQNAEKSARSAGTLPGYRKVSLGVLLVVGGGADWEYTWQPAAGPRLHTHRVLLAAGRGRSFDLSWTTPDDAWSLNLINQRTLLNGLRDPSAPASTWAVPAPSDTAR